MNVGLKRHLRRYDRRGRVLHRVHRVHLPRRSVAYVYMQIAQVMEEVTKQVHHVVYVVAESLAPIVTAAQHN